jgi:hypothetical protein
MVFNDSGEKYRNLCSKQISDFYIKSNMNIDICEFSLVAAKVFTLKLEECAHIIYYLIYGRFASHPYIRSICSKHDYDFKRKALKKSSKTPQTVSNNNTINMAGRNSDAPSKDYSEYQIKLFSK